MTEQDWSDWSEWEREDFGDQWDMKAGQLVRLRLKSIGQVSTKYGEKPMITADVDVIKEDGSGYQTFSDSGIFGQWFINQFRDHLPYTALGVIKQIPTDKGNPMWALSKASDEQRETATKALDVPPF